MEQHETKCPCEGCVVFAVCNGKKEKDDINRLFIIELAVKCKLLHSFLLSGDHGHGVSPQNQKIDATRYVFGLR